MKCLKYVVGTKNVMDAHLATSQQINVTRRNYFGTKLYFLLNYICLT